ncbi:MAG: glycosyltransferase family 2 protein [Solirubrobacterales bacterium]
MSDQDAVAVEELGGAPERPVMREPDLVSVVSPVFDEEETLRAFHDRVVSALAGLDLELVLVDDGSRDATPRILAELAAGDPRIKVVSLSRNFGHQAALTAGLDNARGDAVVMLDSDLQDPPELIPTMLDHWRRGSDVVFAVRTVRTGETRLKLATASWFYRLFSRLAQIELTRNSGDFRLLDRRALDALGAMRERNRFLRGMTVWVGFTQTAVSYERDPRPAGETKYTPRKMLRFSLDAISSFSHVPLQLATVMGFIVSAIAFLGIPIAIGLRIAGEFVPGIASVLLAVLLLGGIQLITVGIIGEYLGRVYDEVKQRPLYVVRDRVNICGPIRDSPAMETHADPADRERART